jgi:hypothetical protein
VVIRVISEVPTCGDQGRSVGSNSGQLPAVRRDYVQGQLLLAKRSRMDERTSANARNARPRRHCEFDARLPVPAAPFSAVVMPSLLRTPAVWSLNCHEFSQRV